MPVKLPRTAGGWGAIRYSLKLAVRAGGLIPLLRALFTRNSCKSCALGMGGQKGGLRDEKGHFPAVCNKSFLAQASDMQGALPAGFFNRHDIETLKTWHPRDLERSGRLTQPVICEPGQTHYHPISWEDAFNRIAGQLKETSPDRTFFYASGRSSNEAAFLLQIFARTYGTNDINNCSYYCHQASGVGLSRSMGTGTATVQLDDLDHADLIFLIGANPASNHPRFMRILMDVRRRGGRVVVINPARERGLENFSVPSDFSSLLFGSEIASTYLQPHIGGDIPLLKGIAKALLALESTHPGTIDRKFVENHTEHFPEFERDLNHLSWEELGKVSGLARHEMEDIAIQYAESRNVVFAWAMGVTHHSHGVDNIHSVVNLALMRGMVGRTHAGLLPLRGHSNVQGVGSVGFTPKLKQAILEKLEARFPIRLPQTPGLDTLGCMEKAHGGGFDFAWNLGGNLFGSNPDSAFAEEALGKIGFTLYMNTTLNSGHFRGKGQTSLILPVLARDEEPEPTTQESMFNFVRMSDGGPERYPGPKSEVKIIAEVASRVFPENRPLPWQDFHRNDNIRELVGSVIPGFEKMREMDRTREEFHIGGRILHQPIFPTPSGKATFKVCPIPKTAAHGETGTFKLMTVRSEGQFNTVVYDMEDRYRGTRTRNVVFMNPEDIGRCGYREGENVTVRNETGSLSGLSIVPYPVKSGNIMMYYPEANVLVPRAADPLSKTPSFKSIDVRLEKGK